MSGTNTKFQVANNEDFTDPTISYDGTYKTYYNTTSGQLTKSIPLYSRVQQISNDRVSAWSSTRMFKIITPQRVITKMVNNISSSNLIYINSMTHDSVNNVFYFCGYTILDISGSYYGAFVGKCNGAGVIQWIKRVVSSSFVGNTRAYDLKVKDGYLYFTTNFTNSSNMKHGIVFGRITSDGGSLTYKILETAETIENCQIEVDDSGNVYFAAIYYNTTYYVVYGKFVYSTASVSYIKKFASPIPNYQLKFKFNNDNTYLYLCNVFYYIPSGSSQNSYDSEILKINPSTGNIVVSKKLTGSYIDTTTSSNYIFNGLSIDFDSNNNIILCGYGAVNDIDINTYRAYIGQFTSDLVLMSQKTFSLYYFYDVVVDDSNGNIFVLGSSYDMKSVYLIKLDKYFNKIWIKKYAFTNTTTSFTTNINNIMCIDNDSNIHCTFLNSYFRDFLTQSSDGGGIGVVSNYSDMTISIDDSIVESGSSLTVADKAITIEDDTTFTVNLTITDIAVTTNTVISSSVITY